jgi:hypothetical protein
VKNVRQFCIAVVFTIGLTIPVFAGEIQLPGENASVKPQTPGTTAAGEISFPGATADPLTEMALGFLLNVSSLL